MIYPNLVEKQIGWGKTTQLTAVKQISMAGTKNYIPQYIWDIITCPCPRCFWHTCPHTMYIVKSPYGTVLYHDNVMTWQHFWHYCITMTSLWARWRLKSPASRLFTQPFIQGADQRKIKAPRYWPSWGGGGGGIHRWPVNSPHKGPVTRKMFPFNDVIMWPCVGYPPVTRRFPSESCGDM